MTREDFRRELGNALDEISGSASPALPDRVRSAVAEAPEQRGPVWIASVAAALIAVILVGALVAASTLNRHVPAGGPHVGPSISPASTPSSSPAPSPQVSATPSTPPDASLPPFVCTSFTITLQNPPQTAFIDDVRTGAHTGYDRVTIQFSNGHPASIELRPQSGTTFTNSPSGKSVTLAGQAGILVVIRGSDAHTAYRGSTDFTKAYPALVEVRQVEDFEGVVQWALGLSKTACYRGFMLSNPARLVIDIQVS